MISVIEDKQVVDVREGVVGPVWFRVAVADDREPPVEGFLWC